MKILKAQLDWMGSWANSPDLRVLIDAYPNTDNLRYRRSMSLYYAHLEGLARFYYYAKPDRGFGGREYKITLEDGSEKILKGPWSSNSGAVNKHFEPHCVSVIMTDEPEVWERGHTFCAGAMTIEFVKEQITEVEIVGLQKSHRAKVDEKVTPQLDFNTGNLIMKRDTKHGWYEFGVEHEGEEYYKGS
jgi:hypothetical protein